MDFIKDLEDTAHILTFDTQVYKQNDVVKDAAIFGMADPRLKEKVESVRQAHSVHPGFNPPEEN